MLFITNRRLAASARSQAGRMIEFDLADNEPASSVYFCERHVAHGYQELTSQPFCDRLRRSPAKQILFFTHGYNTLPEDAFATAAELQLGCDSVEPGLVEVVPIIWPCDSDLGLLRDYWDDQVAAEQSALAFSRAIHLFTRWRDERDGKAEPCFKHMNVLAHSMGNRLLVHAVKRWNEDAGAQALWRNVFLAAADIPNESLEPQGIAASLPSVSRNVTVYYAADDFALRTSKVVNLKNRVLTRRLGHTGPENPALVRRNVFSLDCSDFNNSYDRIGHSYFVNDSDGKPGLVLKHMVDAMKTGRVRGMELDVREARLAANDDDAQDIGRLARA